MKAPSVLIEAVAVALLNVDRRGSNIPPATSLGGLLDPAEPKYRRDQAEAAITAYLTSVLFKAEPREGGHTFITAPGFPGFSLMLNPGESNGGLLAIFAEFVRAEARAAVDPRPLSEYHEDMGPVLWWCFPVKEPPYVGSPLDLGRAVELTIRDSVRDYTYTEHIGGWPGYHTHFTPLPPVPTPPTEKEYCGECLREGVECTYPECLKEQCQDNEAMHVKTWGLP